MRVPFEYQGIKAEVETEFVPFPRGGADARMVESYLTGTNIPATGVVLYPGDANYESEDAGTLIGEMTNNVDMMGWDWDLQGDTLEEWVSNSRVDTSSPS